MKTYSYFLVSILFFVSLLLTSCQNKTRNKVNRNQARVGNSIDSTTIKALFSEDLIRKTFNIPDDIPLKKTYRDRSNIYVYEWQPDNADSKTPISYHISINFPNMEKKDRKKIDLMWESQNNNEQAYKNRDLITINGVGNRATWTDLGGGQLRVENQGYLFFINTSVYGKKWADEDKIEKSKVLGKAVVEQM